MGHAVGDSQRSTILGITCRFWRASRGPCATARRPRTECCRRPWTESGASSSVRATATGRWSKSSPQFSLTDCPAKVDAIALNRRRVEHGLLSVGLKIHCLGSGSEFSALVERLGGKEQILEVNHYKNAKASLCLVLPPVGNARSAVLLLECIEHFIRSALFSNPQIQMCPAAMPTDAAPASALQDSWAGTSSRRPAGDC